jgi:hypothetical protein
MSSHKFKVEDFVTLRQGNNRFAPPSDVFEVIKQLPGSSELEYRIKSVNEPLRAKASLSRLSPHGSNVSRIR